ncbi:MAG: tyrosine-protein phosphatase [Candidatus Sericytochromatia bacterium]
MKKILGLISCFLIISCQANNTELSNINIEENSINNVSVLSNNYKKVSEREPNYKNTLKNDGTQEPKVENIFRFGKVNNTLYRGGLPTETDLQALKNFGVKTIVSFRGLGDPNEKFQVAEEEKLTKALGMKFLNIQVPFDTPVSETTIKEFFKQVTTKANQPLFVHCKGGRDRTGTMVALYRIQYEKYNATKAIEEMKTFTFNPVDYPIFTKQIQEFKPFK